MERYGTQAWCVGKQMATDIPGTLAAVAQLGYEGIELENTFGEDLRIANGRLYKESEDGYMLVSAPRKVKAAAVLPVDSEAVQRVLKNGSYIYDDPALSLDPAINLQGEYAIPAAITVRTKSKRWIFVF